MDQVRLSHSARVTRRGRRAAARSSAMLRSRRRDMRPGAVEPRRLAVDQQQEAVVEAERAAQVARDHARRLVAVERATTSLATSRSDTSWTLVSMRRRWLRSSSTRGPDGVEERRRPHVSTSTAGADSRDKRAPRPPGA
jgi:hypothetical protein